jgi:SAM-dependent methyltransferase
MPNPEKILQTGLGFWPSKTLLSAVELGVFTELASGPADLDTLRSRLGLHPRAAADFFDSLVALGFLQREDGQYTNTEETALFLDRSKPTYVGGILEMANLRLFDAWSRLSTGLRTGEPQNELRLGGKESPFAVIYADPNRLKSFLSAMTGISHGANIEIAKKVPWKHYKTFADLGTAQGDLAVQIALANPQLTGFGYDLSPVQPIFEEYAAHNGIADRLRFQTGDFFRDALPQVDVLTMGHILHDWNLEEKKALIRKAYDAIRPGGALVVYDSIIDDDRSKNAFGLLMSLNMLIETPGGFDYTAADCCRWLQDAGFVKTQVEHLVGPDSMVVGYK